MKQTAVALCASVLLIALFSSCTSLKSAHYVGEKVASSMNDLKADSVWQMGDAVLH
jgi:outer membrane protein assembly factor BamE (lipoprotein component of BamABCDE complex)